MAIKMRNNNKPDSICCECGLTRKKVLDMFDVCIGGNIFTICDLCNEALFKKTLSASCQTNHRVKSKEDMLIINTRNRNRHFSEELKDKLKYSKEETKEIERRSAFLEGEDDG